MIGLLVAADALGLLVAFVLLRHRRGFLTYVGCRLIDLAPRLDDLGQRMVDAAYPEPGPLGPLSQLSIGYQAYGPNSAFSTDGIVEHFFGDLDRVHESGRRYYIYGRRAFDPKPPTESFSGYFAGDPTGGLSGGGVDEFSRGLIEQLDASVRLDHALFSMPDPENENKMREMLGLPLRSA